MSTETEGVRRPLSWRTPAVIMLCGCLIGILSFGPRTGLAFFLTPMSSAYGWGRDVFALALAIQMLLWGAAQPFAGAIADRYGAMPVLSVGALLYALGLAAMAYSIDAGHAPSHRRRGGRLRACRRLVHHRDRRVRQADAAGMADARLRRRHGVGLVRTIPVLAALGGADRAASAGSTRW